MTEEIENNILLNSNVFNRIEQDVYVHISLDPETLTADECLSREIESTILIYHLQEQQKVIKHLMKFFDVTVREVENFNHPTLSSRLERDIKWKISGLLDNMLHKEFLVDCYKIKLQFRQKHVEFCKKRMTLL
ncbi:hypothetical protein CEXT_612441 [Caerostris extrusa]|uniref:Uncharacterized protein n=1 Tax=Caerostris extrusa TaxID=172846 RepID=A0AAV4XJN1_CAEEX|nr:hypothetical protein CEXT_612441 [Caerostris extrusa]